MCCTKTSNFLTQIYNIFLFSTVFTLPCPQFVISLLQYIPILDRRCIIVVAYQKCILFYFYFVFRLSKTEQKENKKQFYLCHAVAHRSHEPKSAYSSQNVSKSRFIVELCIEMVSNHFNHSIWIESDSNYNIFICLLPQNVFRSKILVSFLCCQILKLSYALMDATLKIANKITCIKFEKNLFWIILKNGKIIWVDFLNELASNDCFTHRTHLSSLLTESGNEFIPSGAGLSFLHNHFRGTFFAFDFFCTHSKQGSKLKQAEIC